MSNNKQKKIIFYYLIPFILLILNFNIAIASPFLDGLTETASKTGHGTSTTWAPGNLPGAVGKIIGGALALLGVIFLGLLIYGGILWMISKGNDQEIEKSKKIIQDATIGLIIVLMAYAITAFIGTIIKN